MVSIYGNYNLKRKCWNWLAWSGEGHSASLEKNNNNNNKKKKKKRSPGLFQELGGNVDLQIVKGQKKKYNYHFTDIIVQQLITI